jgi:hypothetical protein
VICPGCNFVTKSEVIRTLGGTLAIPFLTRIRHCPCGHTGVTEERFVSTGGLPADYGQSTGRLPAAQRNGELLPAALGRLPAGTGRLPVAAGGVGGGLSTDPASGVDPVSDPVSASVSAPVRKPSQQSGSGARARGPRRATEYGPEFLVFWGAYPKKKGKGKAWRAWQSLKPPFDTVMAALAWQVEQFDWVKEGGKYVPKAANWIEDAGWDDEPDAVAPLPKMAMQTSIVGHSWLGKYTGGAR